MELSAARESFSDPLAFAAQILWLKAESECTHLTGYCGRDGLGNRVRSIGDHIRRDESESRPNLGERLNGIRIGAALGIRTATATTRARESNSTARR